MSSGPLVLPQLNVSVLLLFPVSVEEQRHTEMKLNVSVSKGFISINAQCYQRNFLKKREKLVLNYINMKRRN